MIKNFRTITQTHRKPTIWIKLSSVHISENQDILPIICLTWNNSNLEKNLKEIVTIRKYYNNMHK